jgi:hypothetical protein
VKNGKLFQYPHLPARAILGTKAYVEASGFEGRLAKSCVKEIVQLDREMEVTTGPLTVGSR